MMIDRIKVSVVLDLDCGNTNEEYMINKLPNEKNKFSEMRVSPFSV